MFDGLFSRLFGRTLDAAGGRFDAAVLALIAFVTGLAAVPLIARHFFWIGLGVFLASRVIWAIRGRGVYEAAPILESVSLAAAPFGFALGNPSLGLAAALMMFGLTAQSMTALKFGRGWIAQIAVSLAIAVACVFPGWFGIVAYVTAVLCFVAAGVQIGASGRSS